MLKFYRRNTKAIIWIIVLSFVVWAVGTLGITLTSSQSYAGSIRGEKITNKEFNATMQFYELITRGQNESKTPSESFSYEQLHALTWQTIIISREAKRQGIMVSDEEIKAEIEKMFGINGQLGVPFYQNWVEQNFKGRPRDFEEMIRRHLAVQKIRQKVLTGVPEADHDKQWLQWLTNTIGSTQLRDFSVKK